jgi:alpha-galactosidase
MGLGVLQILDRQAGLARFAGPGGWNDPDMLEVGNGGMTDDEYRAHFALWAILGAPLIAGDDVRNMDAKTHAILTNAAVIRVSQDRAGEAGDRLARIGDADIWGRRLENGGLATALLNRGTTSMEIRIDAKLLGLASGTWRLRDLWNDRDFGTLGDFRAFVVAPHSALMLTIIPDG